eukprot:4571994-Amphidinium_carterae.2
MCDNDALLASQEVGWKKTKDLAVYTACLRPQTCSFCLSCTTGYRVLAILFASKSDCQYKDCDLQLNQQPLGHAHSTATLCSGQASTLKMSSWGKRHTKFTMMEDLRVLEVDYVQMHLSAPKQ